jgi:hypothetical protein
MHRLLVSTKPGTGERGYVEIEIGGGGEGVVEGTSAEGDVFWGRRASAWR